MMHHSCISRGVSRAGGAVQETLEVLILRVIGQHCCTSRLIKKLKPRTGSGPAKRIDARPVRLRLIDRRLSLPPDLGPFSPPQQILDPVERGSEPAGLGTGFRLGVSSRESIG